MRWLRNLLAASGNEHLAPRLDAAIGTIERAKAEASNLSAHADVIAEARSMVTAARFAEALRLLRQALQSAPADPDLLHAHASTLFEWGRLREAYPEYARVAAMESADKKVHLHLGWTCFNLGEVVEAEFWLRKAVAAEPEEPKVYFGLAMALQAQKNLDEAIATFERGLALLPDQIDALNMMGGARLDQGGQALAAEAIFRRAIAVDAQRPAAWTNLGLALGQQDRFGEALDALQHAEQLVEKHGEQTDNFVNLAVDLSADSQVEASLAVSERNLPQCPSIIGHFNYALALLKRGRMIEGFRQYEFRFLQDPSLSHLAGARRPVWDGQNLQGKTILLRSEQGIGDVVQFIRYAPIVKSLGAHVLLDVRAGLEPFARSFPGVDQVIGPGDTYPPFDYYIHLMSLPRALATDLHSIPADVPYLQPDPERRAKWSGVVAADTRLKVGLVWAGDPRHRADRHRSLPLQALAPWWEVDGVRFFSLQKGPAAAQLEALPVGMPLTDLGPDLEDYRDTAAAIDALDLIVGVDTSALHLAGALGKPVWMMLPSAVDWRWLEKRDDTPWYPTMRLFRQQQRTEWSDVVVRIKDALTAMVRLPATARVAAAANPAGTARTPMRRMVPDDGGIQRSVPGLAEAADTRFGVLQYVPDEKEIGPSLGWYGEYAQLQIDFLARFVRPGATIVEAGAGVGAHTFALSAMAGDAGALFLYEANRIARRILRQNLGAHRVRNVTIMQRLLGSAPFQASGNGSDVTESGEELGVPAVEAATETVDELQLRRLDLLKINAGVAGAAVLDGARDSLWQLRPLLFVDAADENVLNALVGRAKEWSYRCWRIELPLFNPGNHNCRDTDIFSGRTKLAMMGIPEELDLDAAMAEHRELA